MATYDKEKFSHSTGNHHIWCAVLQTASLIWLICCTAILTLRVYALFNRHQAILVLLSVVGLGSLAIGVVRVSVIDLNYN
jgi:hypothetical protein